MKDITLLCKVVDNYGDIGFVYRLAKNMSLRDPDRHLRLIVSNLESFSKLAPEIDKDKPFQIFNGWEIYDWNNDEVCYKAFRENEPVLILETFQCGRPDWLDKLLFDDGVKEIVQILNIEYLTAEEYADNFHCLQSLTRSARVKKKFFMPGFTGKTGGLVLDEPFVSQWKKRQSEQTENIETLPFGKKQFNILMFSYEKEFTPIVNAIKEFEDFIKETVPEFKVKVHVARGIGNQSFIECWEKCGSPFEMEKLGFLRQEDWDKMFFDMDFLFIRGEDSMARACLTGIPFVWNAYIQDENYQLVKVDALLQRMKPFFGNDFEKMNEFWRAYNGDEGLEGNMKELTFNALKDTFRLKPKFSSFSDSLFKNGNLTSHLLSFICELK